MILVYLFFAGHTLITAIICLSVFILYKYSCYLYYYYYYEYIDRHSKQTIGLREDWNFNAEELVSTVTNIQH